MKKIFLFFLMTFNVLLFAQSGSLDPTFNVGDFGVKGFNNKVHTILRLSDGKVLVGGQFTKYNNITVNGIARLNADGSLDETFNAGGVGFQFTRTTSTSYSMIVKSIVLQGSKILVGGAFDKYNNIAKTNILRLNNDGSLDDTFVGTTSAHVQSLVNSIVLHDDKVVLGGAFLTSDYKNVIRLTTDGTSDSSFNIVPANFNIVNVVYRDTALNKYLIGGGERQDDNTVLGYKSFLRLNDDGTVDTNFTNSTSSIANGSMVNDIVGDGQGGYYVGGYIKTYKGTQNIGGLMHIDTNGVLDLDFNTNIGAGAILKQTPLEGGHIYKILRVANGNLYVGGKFILFNGEDAKSFVKLNAVGETITSFEKPVLSPINVSASIYPEIRTIALNGTTSSSDVFLGGFFDKVGYNNAKHVLKMTSNGSFVSNFRPNGIGPDGIVNDAVKLADGKIIIVGDFSYYDGVYRSKVARINANGTLDTTFNPILGFNGVARGVKMTSDGKVVVVGAFTSYNGSDVKGVVRLNSDGSKDTSFQTEIGMNGELFAVETTAEGIYIGGSFSIFGTKETSIIARLANDGTLDTNFNKSPVSYSSLGNVYHIKKMHNGDILIAGDFYRINGSANGQSGVRNVAIFGANGNFKGSGSTNQPNGVVTGIGQLSTNQTVIAGKFNNSQFNSGANGYFALQGIYKYTTSMIGTSSFDGSAMVSGFEIGPEKTISSILVQPDDKIIIAGGFNIPSNRIFRINSSAIGNNRDTSFNAGTGPNGDINKMILLDDDKVLLMGNFTSYNNVDRSYLAVISIATTPIPDVVANQNVCRGTKISQLEAIGVNLKYYTLSGSTYTLVASPSTTDVLARDYYVSQVINGFESEKTKVTVTLKELVNVPEIEEEQTLAVGKTLADIVIIDGENIKWYATQADAKDHVNVLDNTTVLVDGATYYATQTNLTTGCESTLSTSVTITLDGTLGNSEIKNIKTSLYPNPAKDFINFKIASRIDKVLIYSIDGKKVTEGLVTNNQFNVSRLAKGIYILQLLTSNGVETLKLIKD